MGDAGYIGAASCLTSGIHHLDLETGFCQSCRTRILRRAGAPTATESAEAAKKKGRASWRAPRNSTR